MRLGGTVVQGAGRGRSLGFPTGNLDTAPEAGWPHGLYAVHARIDDAPRRPGIMNLGLRPTFGDQATPVAEVHLLDHDGHDLYGCRLDVLPVAFLLPERRFADAEALRVHLAEVQRAVRAGWGLGLRTRARRAPGPTA